MPAVDRFTHEFVNFVPDTLIEGVLYVSLPYTTAIHLCACGCGNQVVSALDPDDYSITFDGETISLWPSIGNWDYHCRSHYVIRRGNVHWAPMLSETAIAAGRNLDRWTKRTRAAGLNPDKSTTPTQDPCSSHVLRASNPGIATQSVKTRMRDLLRRMTRCH